MQNWNFFLGVGCIFQGPLADNFFWYLDNFFLYFLGITTKLFNDVFISPLHVSELSEIIIQLIKRKVTGLYHVSSQDSLSKHDFGLIMAETFECSTEYFDEISSSLLLYFGSPQNFSPSSMKFVFNDAGSITVTFLLFKNNLRN